MLDNNDDFRELVEPWNYIGEDMAKLLRSVPKY